MRDFKYSSLLQGKYEWDKFVIAINEIKSGSLKELASAYALNLGRTLNFAAMPSEIAFMVRRDQIIWDNAVRKITGKNQIDFEDFISETPFSGGVDSEAKKQMVEFKKLPSDQRNRFKAGLGIGYIEYHLHEGSKGMADSIDSIYASIILGSWTAFECLASDLWEVAVNDGPGIVAARLNVAKLNKGDESITPQTVHALGLNPKTHYGTFLKETGKVSFQKLEHIKLFYSIAFGDHFKKIFDDTSGGYIFALALARNALIHKSGVADKKFLESCKRFDEWKGVALNETILFDGEIVRKLRNAAREVGLDLLIHIDCILSNPETA